MSKGRGKKGETGLSWKSLKSEWRAWYDAKKPVLFFALKFGGLIALLYALLATSFFDRALYSYLQANAWLANGILHATGQNTHLSDITVSSSRFSMTIRRGCDAVEPTWIFCAALVAFPASFRHKIAGMLVGIVCLQLLNLVRIVTLYWIGVHWPSFFNSAHLEIWPALFILVSIFLFVLWRTSPVPARESHAS